MLFLRSGHKARANNPPIRPMSRTTTSLNLKLIIVIAKKTMAIEQKTLKNIPLIKLTPAKSSNTANAERKVELDIDTLPRRLTTQWGIQAFIQ